MHGNNARENREIPGLPLIRRAVSGSRKAYADDERAGEVGPKGSTCEVPEQSWTANGGGGDGGKPSDQRKLASAKHPSDSRPGKDAKCAGAGTSASIEGEEAQVH